MADLQNTPQPTESSVSKIERRWAEVDEWLEPLLRFGGNYEVLERTEYVFRFRLYTDRFSYTINAHIGDKSRDYIGAVSTTRKPRAGETHNRGNDLHDGPLTRETFIGILADIVAYEMVPLDIQDKNLSVLIPVE